MNTREFQVLISERIFEARQGGSPVTVLIDGNIRQIEDFVWCHIHNEFHITTDKVEIGFRGPAYDESI